MRAVAAIRELRLVGLSTIAFAAPRTRCIGRQSLIRRTEEETWLNPVLLMTSRRSVRQRPHAKPIRDDGVGGGVVICGALSRSGASRPSAVNTDEW